MEQSNTLVIITNQYMLAQFEWYHSLNSADKCDAVVVNFDSSDLLSRMEEHCKKNDLFKNVYVYNNLLSEIDILSKIFLMLKYVMLNIMRKKKKYDLNLVETVMGKKDYQKIVIPSNYITFCVAAINAYPEAEIICMEDGFADYGEFVKGIKQFSPGYFLKLILAKLDILNYASGEYHFMMKSDYRMIKYASLPEKLKYRGYKEIRQLFCDYNQKTIDKKDIKEDKKYDIILFSTRFEGWMKDTSSCYNLLHQWIKEEYAEKSILIKKHPRERYEFLWDDMNIDIYSGNLSGEELLDALPSCEIVMLYTSTLLLKLCREKRNFKIVRMSNVPNKMYYKGMKNDAKVVELDEDIWIDLDEK